MKALTEDRREELIEEVREIQDELAGLVDRLEQIVREVDDSYLREYLVVQLKIRVSSEHGYLTDDPSLDNLIEAIERVGGEGFDEEE